MNIIKIQNQLKGVPDDTLVGYVQNPTGQVPTYLALSELQRRKEMRSKFQANKPEEKSVAEDLVQEVQPPMQGVAGLPEAQPMMEAMQPPPEMPMQAMAQGGLADLDTGDMYDENNYANGGIVAFAGREGSYVQSDDPYADMYGSDLERAMALKQYELDKKKRLKDKGFPSLLTSPPTKPEQYDVNALAAKVGKGGYDRTLESPVLSDAEVAINKAIEESKKNPFTDKSQFNFNAPVEKVKDMKSYADEFKNYIGDDPMRQKLADRLTKMEERATRQEEQAPWLALARAGFEMASSRPEYGKGQSALADIARGAGAGIKEYGEARDRLNTLEERRFNIENELAKAQRAETMAVAKFGADSRQAAEARAHAEKLHNSSINTQVKIAEMNATINSQNRLISAKDKLEDNVRAKIKQIHGEGSLSPEEYDKVFKKYLSEAYAQFGVAGAPAATSTMPANMTFDPKTKEYTYKPS
jgi:F0F1-type ATP synthase membrane subunit b/b'